ncbi:LANO_0F06106g1_1 [Lachancea nothofagi CBS 11611]|uniref:LANO_0F06106g1_1 n=1 Tax=Lachancea nothofagi CBS 11611 TaxID=1266666 RepID=A0A1G4K8J0_9SACH|nr:LANO_0F06106g1_1 [Lachancea nothofagi CBS 11611]
MIKTYRRPSLVYDDDDEPKDARKFRTPSQVVGATLDNTDLVALTTSFDRQITEGHPMYFDQNEGLDTSQRDEFDSGAGPLLQTKGSSLDCDRGVIIETVEKLRTAYLQESAQNAALNLKYDKDAWFLYPKPLPKFWKFEKDKRLQDRPAGTTLKGYFGTRASDDDARVAEKVKLHYTGQFFELSHYTQEFKKFVNLEGASSSSVLHPYDDIKASILPISSFGEHFEKLAGYIESEEFNFLAVKRTEYLLHRFHLFQQLQGCAEVRETRLVPHRDFYNIRKVDQNYILSGCFSQRQLNEFIWEKLNLEPDRIIYKDLHGNEFKLRQIFCDGADAKCNEDASIGLKAVDDIFLDWYQTIYLSGMHLTGSHSLQGQNLKFYLIAQTFMEFDNYIAGEYFAELVIKYVIQSFEKSKYQLAQLSVDFQFTGDWWTKFCTWVTKWKLVSYNIRWNIRFSRNYTKLHDIGLVRSFQDYLDYIFQPLFSFEAQQDMKLQYVLSTICCFDVVADESDDYLWKSFKDPQSTIPVEWCATGDNPPLAYYTFYIYQYLRSLNQERKRRKQNTITLRNYCPASRSRVSQFRQGVSITEQLESLICNILLCGGGLLQAEQLWDASPAILYLYYLFQIPVVVSPLSSVSLTRELGQSSRIERSPTVNRDVTAHSAKSYTGNPFMDMHKMGLKVILSSSSVLFNCSYTMEPIIEEYSVAASIHLLSSADMCELVRDSVLTSGYEGFYKAHWNGIGLTKTSFFNEKIGCTDLWYDLELDTCYKHNVPTTRRLYRRDCLIREWHFVRA